MPIASYVPNKKTLGEVLSSTSPPIRVPDYQRDYSWQTKHVNDFWNDLIVFDQQFPANAVQGKEYFLGSAVLVQTATHNLLLDGQQRLATATILLSALRDRIKPHNNNAGDQIQDKYIVFVNYLAGGGSTYKLQLNAFDRDFFKARIQDSPAPAVLPLPAQRSHRLIIAARAFFDQKLTAIWNGAQPAQAFQHLSRLAMILTENFGFVVVSSTDEDDAAMIFETLNDRGIGLSTADLLRSWLLTKAAAGAVRDEILDLWTKIFKAVKTERPEIAIRASWVSRHGDVKARSMYKEIKDKLIADAIEPLAYTRELHNDVLIYSELVSGATGDAVVDEVCKGLVQLKAAGCLAPLIAAKRTYNAADLESVARAIASLAVRHNLICRRDPTKLEEKAFEIAEMISSNQPLAPVLASLRQLSPPDAEFDTNFSTLVFKPTKHSTVQIILRTIENNRKNTGEKIIAPPQKVNIEHIYPQTPDPADRWADHEAQVFRLGNLTLLGQPLNAQIQNALFPLKVPAYQQSTFLITQELTAYQQWTTAEITARQSALGTEARTIWPAALA
jgi:hypothetical protein